jgi:ATP-dependent Clp protease ATP-binding subunit ClpC
MNNLILPELKRVVEQAVRPVRATMARKRRMREELLAHLLAIFEEEAVPLGNEQAALAGARRRFGDPRELTAELQETVPWWDKLARLGEAAELRGPRESLLHFAARLAILGIMFVAVPMPILAPIVSFCGRRNELDIVAWTLFVVGMLNVPLTVGFILLTDGMYRSLYRGPKSRSWRQAAVYGLLSMAFFPLLAFAWCWSLTGNLAMSWAQLRLGCYFAPLAPVLFAGLASQAAKQLRDYEEWASLEVDGYGPKTLVTR